MESWEKFFDEKIKKIFIEKKLIIDIGGGLRLSKNKGNRYNRRREWIGEYLKDVNYKILDPVPDYNPDIVGDIHNLPLENESVDAIICIAVLEHVENPFKAVEEIYRVLRPGGYCFIYVPFLYYYHADVGYYKDYWRFSRDAIDLLFKKFSNIETQNVRGPLATLIKLSPPGRLKFLEKFGNLLDRIFKKQKSKQTSGYNVFLIK